MRRACLAGAMLLAACASCRRAPAPPAEPTGKPLVFVSILPQAEFVQRVGGERVDVAVLLPPGQSPATYEPSPRQMTKLGRAQVYFRIGVPFERALLRKIASAMPKLNIVDTSQGIKLRRMAAGHDHEHGAGAADPHTWLDPKLVKIQAGTIAHALTALAPAHAAEFERNLQSFQAELDRLDAKIAATLAPLRGRELFVFHPAYGYFADAYGLKQVAVELEGKEPSARALGALIERAKARGVKVMFVQPQFSSKAAATVARAIGGAVVPMDPLARDYESNLESMAASVRAALGGKAP